MRRAFFTIRTVQTYSWRAGSKTRQNANATREKKKKRAVSLFVAASILSSALCLPASLSEDFLRVQEKPPRAKKKKRRSRDVDVFELGRRLLRDAFGHGFDLLHRPELVHLVLALRHERAQRVIPAHGRHQLRGERVCSLPMVQIRDARD